MNKNTSILLCGSGSGGHVAPLVAVAETLRAAGISSFEVVTGPREEETSLMRAAGITSRTSNVPGKPTTLLAAITFPFRMVAAFIRAGVLIRSRSPSVVFSKGGRVPGPIALAAWCHGTPVIIHESDSVISHGGSLLGRIARTVCTGFPPTTFPDWAQRKVVHTGNPVRQFMRTGNRFAVQRITGFSGRRPVLMVIGGSQGSVTLNTWVDRNFDALLDSADVIHITGIGKGISRTHARYFSRPYVLEELPHLYAIADVVVTRAGAAALSELALLRKAAVVVPLAGVGHDHQVRNGEALTKAGAAVVIEETNEKDLLPSVQSLLLDPERRTLLGDALYRMFPDDAASRLARVILDASEGKRLESRPTSPSSHA